MDLVGIWDTILNNFSIIYLVLIFGFGVYFTVKSGNYARMKKDAMEASTDFIALKLIFSHSVANIWQFLQGYLQYFFFLIIMLFILGLIYSLSDFEGFVIFAFALAIARMNMLLRELGKTKYLVLTPDELERVRKGDPELRKVVDSMEEPKDLNKIKEAIGLTVEGKPK